MTVNTTNITSGPYVGNGASDTYSYTFRVADKTQLSVYETDDAGVQTLLTVDTDYTVVDVGEDVGGTIVRVAGNLPTDYQWYIRSNYIENQLTAFASQGGFFSDVHEAQMDHITFLVQQLRDAMDRSFSLSDSIGIDGSFSLSDIAADRIGKILGFDTNGDLSIVTLNNDFINVYLGSKSSDPTTDNLGGALIDGALYYNTVTTVVMVYDLGTTTWLSLTESFDVVYLGSKSSDPTTDNRGNALIDGALYYNTVAKILKVYDLGTTTWVSTVAPAATESVSGILELATQAETDTGTDDTRAVTPLKLKNFPVASVPAATESVSGILELATQAETDAGTDDTRAVTPLKLKNAPAASVPAATESVSGILELATQAETDAGTDDVRAVTPLKLANFPISTTDVLAATAAASVGAVGTYAMLSDSDTVARTPGDTLAGSSLDYTNAAGSALGVSPAGTWRLMGRLINTDTTAPGRASTWLRIS